MMIRSYVKREIKKIKSLPEMTDVDNAVLETYRSVLKEIDIDNARSLMDGFTDEDKKSIGIKAAKMSDCEDISHKEKRFWMVVSMAALPKVDF